MDRIGQFILILLIEFVSPASIATTSVKPIKNEELKTSRTYQVTENIKDIPDNRTLPPIIPNFGLVRPLNFGNNTVAINNIGGENNKESSEENNNEGSSEENNTQNKDGEVKKNSFSLLHITAEYDNKVQNQNVLSKVFGGIKNYVYSLKKGVVDGLHSFFHQHDGNGDKIDKETELHNKHDTFHRNFGEDFGDEQDYYDELKEHFGHY